MKLKENIKKAIQTKKAYETKGREKKKSEMALEVSSLVRPVDLSLISTLSPRYNGITPDAVTSAPTFLQISDRIHDLFHGLYLSLS